MSADTVTAVPWSNEAEQAVLGAVLFDNRAWGRVADILAEADFYSLAHRDVFAAIGRLIGSGHPADVITVNDELRRAANSSDVDLTYLNGLAQSVPSVAGARHYAEIVRKHCRRRALIAVADEATSIARAEPDEGAAIDAITSKFGALLRGQVSDAPVPIAEIAMECLDHSTALQNGSAVSGWPTQLPWLNRALNGGLKPGSLYVLAARPSVGKSSLAQSIGLVTAAAGLPTCFLSMEMTKREVGQRSVANVGRVSYEALQTGTMTDEQWGRAVDAMEHLSTLAFSVDATPALTLRQVRAKAKAVKGLKILVVDYLQLMTGTRRDGNRNGEVEEISRGLKTLAKELGIAVLALAQLNRQVESRGENKRPRLSDLRDSGAIEQDADVVMFLWPVREFENERRKILGLGIDKNRQGRLGEIGLDFYGDFQRWEQSTADIRPAPAARGRGDDL